MDYTSDIDPYMACEYVCEYIHRRTKHIDPLGILSQTHLTKQSFIK